MKFAHVLNRVTGSPWFITEDALANITNLLESRLSAGRFESVEVDPEKLEPAGVMTRAEGVAVIPVHGILGKHLGLMEMMCGGVDFDVLSGMVRQAAEDSATLATVLHIHSPGGSAIGCAETFATLREIRQKTGKPLYAFCDSVCASAGYYLAAACDGIFATTTAEVGCIGSMLKVTDRSAANAAAGIKRFTFTSARMKDIGNPDRTPTPEEMAHFQSRIDFLGGMFKRDMQAARPQIAGEVFEKGVTYFGAEAEAVGLVDEVIPDISTLISQLSTQFAPAARPTPPAP